MKNKGEAFVFHDYILQRFQRSHARVVIREVHLLYPDPTIEILVIFFEQRLRITRVCFKVLAANLILVIEEVESHRGATSAQEDGIFLKAYEGGMDAKSIVP